MQLGLEGIAEVFWQELSLGGPEMGDCCVDGPEIGLPLMCRWSWNGWIICV